MDEEELINVVTAQKAERDRLARTAAVPREAGKSLNRALKNNLIKVISGPRRAGKSTLAIQALQGKAYSYINFEDEALKGVPGDLLMKAVDSVYGETQYCLFDEIQEHADWEVFLNKLHRRGRNLIITGSNSRLLSSELASSLTGRHEVVNLLPFSLSEFAGLRGEKASCIDYAALCSEWLRTGGYPEVVVSAANESYLRTLFDSTVLRDIVGRHKIRNVLAIKTLGQLLMNSVTARYTARSLERALQTISFATIQKYIAYFTEAWLLFELQAFSFKTRQRVSSDKKIFAVDNGLVRACAQNLIGGEARDLENAVFVELLRKGYVPNLTLFYALTKQRYEVDFLLPNYPKGASIIQVAVSLAGPSTLERELRAMATAAEEFNGTELLIITLNEEGIYSAGNHKVKALPFWKWCLGGEALR